MKKMHLEAVAAKMGAITNIIQKPTGSAWATSASMLRTSTMGICKAGMAEQRLRKKYWDRDLNDAPHHRRNKSNTCGMIRYQS